MKTTKWFDDKKKYYVFRSLNKRFLIPVWGLVMLDGGLSIEQIGVIAIIGVAIGLILEVPSGAISDAIGHKRTLVLAMIGQGAAMLFFAGGGFWWFLAASITYYAMGTFMTGTHQALFYERLIELGEGDKYRKYSGIARTVSSGWSMVAVAFAGIVYAFSPMFAFAVGAGLFWIGAIVVSTMKQAKRKRSVQKDEGFWAVFTHFKTASRTMLKDRRLFWLTIANAFIFSAPMAVLEFQQVIFENIGIVAAVFGFIYAAKRGISMLFSTFIHRITRSLSATGALFIMLCLAALYFFGFGFLQNQMLIIIVALLPSIVVVIQDVVISDFRNKLIPTGSRATTISFGNFIGGILKAVILGAITLLTLFVSIEIAHVIIGAALVKIGRAHV